MKYIVILLIVIQHLSVNAGTAQVITPNDFKGSDIARIQAAIHMAKRTTHKIVIPQGNSNGTGVWKIDRAILLPSYMTIILDNCIIQLSDLCRDNMFRSDNVGVGITDPVWNHNINIIQCRRLQPIANKVINILKNPFKNKFNY